MYLYLIYNSYNNIETISKKPKCSIAFQTGFFYYMKMDYKKII